MRWHLASLSAVLSAASLSLAFSFSLPAAYGQDGDTPPAELDPGQVILPHDPDREVERIELEVGRDTTYFLGPLRDDGTVDYIAALNEKYSEGVTLENNAFVELFLLAPVSDRNENDAEVMAALGLPREREDESACFIRWEEYAEDHGIDPYSDEEYYLSEDNQVTQDGLDWLATNEAAIDRIVAAIDLPRYWSPMVAGEGGEDNMMMVYLPHLGLVREYSRAIQARSYTRAANGDGQGAVRSLIAMRKLAALVRCETTLISGLVGISIDAMALYTTKVLLNSHALDADDIELLVSTWDDPVDIVSMAEFIDIGERSMGLDLIQQLSTGRLGENDVDLFGFNGPGVPGLRLRSARFNINRGLRTLNQHYNTEVQMMRIASYPEWKRRHNEWEERWEADHAILNQDTWGIAGTLGNALLSSDGYTDVVTSIYINMIMSALGAARKTEFRSTTHESVVWLALQCERYRLAMGEVPATLEALVPDYLDEVPMDPMDGEPMRHIVTDTHYTIYSIGTNLEDDGGIHDPRDGDIAVTLEFASE